MHIYDAFQRIAKGWFSKIGQPILSRSQDALIAAKDTQILCLPAATATAAAAPFTATFAATFGCDALKLLGHRLVRFR